VGELARDADVARAARSRLPDEAGPRQAEAEAFVLAKARTQRSQSDGSGAKSSVRTGAKSDVRGHEYGHRCDGGRAPGRALFGPAGRDAACG
jgi:hypothetical protein